MAAYEQIDQFCWRIMDNLSHVCKFRCISWILILFLCVLSYIWHEQLLILTISICRNLQDLSIDVGEAVASLVYAASRCGDLPELQLVRSLFKERFGYEFEILNVELRPGNLVSFELIENLCTNPIPDREKHILVRDIAMEYSLPVENNFARQHQVGYNLYVSQQVSNSIINLYTELMCSILNAWPRMLFVVTIIELGYKVQRMRQQGKMA